jgi:hypothetical protein
MFNVQKHRCKERWLVAKAGLDDDTRRDLLERLFGVRTTTKLTSRQWGPYLDALERLANIPSSWPANAERPYPLDGGATAKQLAEVARLRSRIRWTHPAGPEAGFRAYVAKVCFAAGDEVERYAWEHAEASVRSLPRRIVSRIIRHLKRLAAYSPAPNAADPNMQAAGATAPAAQGVTS